uniref:Uncharacterized protein n=1 Tax=Arundo donax TaxID=35708 RepID=A0A0A8Z0H2_ARUDO
MWADPRLGPSDQRPPLLPAWHTSAPTAVPAHNSTPQLQSLPHHQGAPAATQISSAAATSTHRCSCSPPPSLTLFFCHNHTLYAAVVCYKEIDLQHAELEHHAGRAPPPTDRCGQEPNQVLADLFMRAHMPVLMETAAMNRSRRLRIHFCKVEVKLTHSIYNSNSC